MSETYKIIPLFFGEMLDVVPRGALYYKHYTGDNLSLAFGCFALKSNQTGEVIMVDTGLPPQSWMKENNYPFAYEIFEDAKDMSAVLAEKGIDPLAVKTIVFTHLHQDHCYNLELFPNATLYVQKIELQHAATPTDVERGSYHKLGCTGEPFWARAFHQFVYVEGDVQIQDGIEVMFTPGHTPGSQTVVVQTEAGPYLITGDNYYTQEQFTDGIMNGNFTDLEGWYKSRGRVMDYIRQKGGKIIIFHDPLTYKQDYYG